MSSARSLSAELSWVWPASEVLCHPPVGAGRLDNGNGMPRGLGCPIKCVDPAGLIDTGRFSFRTVACDVRECVMSRFPFGRCRHPTPHGCR